MIIFGIIQQDTAALKFFSSIRWIKTHLRFFLYTTHSTKANIIFLFAFGSHTFDALFCRMFFPFLCESNANGVLHIKIEFTYFFIIKTKYFHNAMKIIFQLLIWLWNKTFQTWIIFENLPIFTFNCSSTRTLRVSSAILNPSLVNYLFQFWLVSEIFWISSEIVDVFVWDAGGQCGARTAQISLTVWVFLWMTTNT